ncbi:MAG: DUF748 domain-containing protein [Bacteroidia bacterium]
MKGKRHALRKTLLITLSILVTLCILVIAFISPIAKYVIEKYDEKFTGREITMDWAYVNPFTGYIHFENFKFHELKSDSSFLSCASISAHANIRKLFSKEYEIKDLTLNKPRVIIVQHQKNAFNFSDLIEKFSKKPDKLRKDTTPVHFSLLEIKIEDGVFIMREEMTPVNYSIKNVQIKSTGKRWNADTINTKFSFDSGIGSGHVQGQFNLNIKKSEYKTAVVIKKLDLKIIEQYMKGLANYGTIRAFVNADIKADGNLKEARKLNTRGSIFITDFHFGKSAKEDFASFDEFSLLINHINPSEKMFMIDSLSLVHPFLKYEKYDHLDNVQNMFGKKGENVKKAAQNPEKFNLIIEIARYVKLLSKDFFRSDYKVNRLGIYKADLHYNDYSLNEKFSIALDPLSVVADSVNSNNKRVKIILRSGIKPYGDLNIGLTINPKDSSDFELAYNLEKVNATVLNPYLVSLTSFPLDRGSIELKGNWNVNNGVITSSNRLLVIDPRITKRIKSNRNKWLPLKLIMFFVRERGNAIDYQIPITGNLKDPRFHLKNVILDIITNVFVKPVTPVYHHEIKTIENNIEKTLAFNWQLRSAVLMPDHIKFVGKVVDFLKDNPAASIVVSPVEYAEKEKEYITFFEAKKKYYLRSHQKSSAQFSEEDSANVEKMSVKDSMFVHYLDKRINTKMMFTTQEKCAAFIGQHTVQHKFMELMKKREEIFRNYFTEAGVEGRVRIRSSVDKVPFDGFSYYKITYNGQIPPETKEAFEKLKEFDNEQPRRKLKSEREKTQLFHPPK